MMALMHAAQSRAVSEGAPMMLWLDAKGGAYGVEAETSGQNGDPKAETLTVDSTLLLSVPNSAADAPTRFKNLPAIRYLPDGMVDEGSPQTVQLTDADGFARLLVQTKMRTGYEISEKAR